MVQLDVFLKCDCLLVKKPLCFITVREFALIASPHDGTLDNLRSTHAS